MNDKVYSKYFLTGKVSNDSGEETGITISDYAVSEESQQHTREEKSFP